MNETERLLEIGKELSWQLMMHDTGLKRLNKEKSTELRKMIKDWYFKIKKIAKQDYHENHIPT